MTTARAILLVGHGTIGDPEDVPEFLRRIRHGRPASPELVGEIRRRYREIGRSPLLAATERLAVAVGRAAGTPAYVAMRFWEPLVEPVVARIAADGVEELALLPVAPFSVHVYGEVVRNAVAAVAEAGARVPVVKVCEPYGGDPLLVEAFRAGTAPYLAGRDPADTALLLSAHSLPLRVVAAGDGYQREFEASASAVAGALGWRAAFVYQSQGEGGGEWLGPTLAESFARAKANGARTVVVAPVGFLADHVETLYDLDIEAAGVAKGMGLELVRVPALNDAPSLVSALAGVAARTFRGAE